MTQKEKGPAEAATSPDHGSNPTTPTGENMNGKIDNTVRMLKKELEHVYGEVADLVHMLHHLDADIDHGLDFQRGDQTKAGAILLLFQKDGLEATRWLTGKSWLKASKLRDHLEGVFDAIVEADGRTAA